MGKRKNRKQDKSAANRKEEKKQDLWENIEQNGGKKTAYQEFYQKPVEVIPKVKYYEQFKNKRKRQSDGDNAERIETHQHPKRSRQEKVEKEFSPKQHKARYHQMHIEELAPEEAPRNGKKKQNGKRVLRENVIISAEVDEQAYIVEEPDDEVAISKINGHISSFPSKKDIFKQARFANLFDGFESDDEDDPEDEEFDVEEVSDEETFDGLEDEEIEDEYIDDNEMVIHPENITELFEEEEPYGSPMSCSEEEMEDEEISDEEDHENCSSCSEVSEQDAESDEEGNLGEDRTANILMKKSKSMPMNFDEFPFSDDDSSVTATRAFAWLISNCDVQTFFNDFYQQNCLVVKRNHSEYYGNLFTSQRLAELLETSYVEYGVNINVAEYKNSVRITPNGKGRAYPRQIKAHLKQGRSVQLTNPQAFDDHIWYICEILQEVFGCFVGANTYLTPAGSSGFAPHWDDIDAFLLQVEGKKYWKIYAPENDTDELPRESSGNFTEADLKKRKPTFEGWLEPGDLLYIPRGFIHQARTDKKTHSLHVTISTGRQWTFADVMDKLIPEAITSLSSERMKMRRGLPIGLLDMNGVADYKYRMDEYFVEKFVVPLDRHMSMLRNFISDTCLESAVDLMAREFMKTALPPLITPAERKFHVLGQSGESLLTGSPLLFQPHIYVRLMRRHGQRLVFETEERCFIAYRINNSRSYEGREEQTIDLDIKFVPAFTTLLDHCPEWTKVGELPDVTDTERRDFCQLLYENGIILAKNVPKKKD